MKKILKSCVVIFLSIQLPKAPLYGAERMVLVRSADVPSADYEMILEADRSYERFRDYWVGRDERERRELRAAYAHAQEVFLSGEIEDMRREWEKVASFALKSDWSKKYRQVIQTAQVRRAQLAVTPAETEQWLHAALAFDPGFDPDQNLFPPPLIESYRRLRTQIHRIHITVGLNSDFDVLLINGVEYGLDKIRNIYLPSAPVRATYLSSRYRPVSRIMNIADLTAFRPERVPLVAGSCATPQSESDIVREATLVIMYSKTCIVKTGGLHIDSGNLPSALRPNEKSDEAITSRFEFRPEESKPFYQNTWFWVGAAALAGAAVAVAQAQSHSGSSSGQPTHTEGF